MWAIRLALRPGLRGADRAGDAVRRLDVGDAEDVVRVRHRLVEQEVGAAVDEDREQLELLGDRAERGRVAARDDAGEEVDLLGELHAAKLLDVGVGAGGLVGLERLDLALAEQAALGVDLLGGEHVALVRRLAQHRGGAGEERHVAGLVGRAGNVALWRFGRGLDQLRSGNQAGAGEAGSADRHAERAEKFSAID